MDAGMKARKHVVRARADSVENIDGLEEKVREATNLLPAWFVPRMMEDEWRFALMLASGDWVPLRRIEGVKQGPAGVWIDALLLDAEGAAALRVAGLKMVPVTLARSHVSLNAQHVAMAIELEHLEAKGGSGKAAGASEAASRKRKAKRG